jgi:hypothetical protein
MASLCVYGGVQPSEFEEMDWEEALWLRDAVQKKVEADMKAQLEVNMKMVEILCKTIVQSAGMRAAGGML